MMKAVNLRGLAREELLNYERETRDKLMDVQLRQSAEDASEKPVRKRVLRREIARILTVLREQEKGA